MTEPTNLIDIEQVEEAVREYAETTDRERQRELENEVLAATVWRTRPEERDDQIALDKEDVATLRENLPEDAEYARMILRRSLFESS